jgi:hypothetical protein
MDTPGSLDSPVVNTPGSLDSPIVNTPGSPLLDVFRTNTRPGLPKTFLVIKRPGNKDFGFLVYFAPVGFFVN